MTRSAQKWAVVGGGILGMMLAHRLARQGKQVTLFEAAPHLGGLASAWSLGNVVWDRHYHVTLLSDSHLRALLQELGLENEIQWVNTRTGFYVDGRLYSMSSALEFLRFPPLSLLQKFRLALTILYASRLNNSKTLETALAVDWLRRWSGKGVAEKIWLPLLRAKLGDLSDRASAAFIWATIQRMYAARRSGLKKEMFGYVPGGYARVLEVFAERLRRDGVTIKLDHPATCVDSAVEGSLRIRFQNGLEDEFPNVVLSMASPIAARLCPQLSTREKSLLNGIQYLGVICASVLLRQPLAGFYVTNITDAWVPFTGVIEMSALVDRKHLGGNSLVYLPKYVSPYDSLLACSDSAIQDLFIPALLRMFPHLQPSDILSFRVSREKYVMALSTLGYSDRLPPMQTSVPGLHIVNSAHIVNGTLNVNETLQLADRALPLLLSSSASDERVAGSPLLAAARCS